MQFSFIIFYIFIFHKKRGQLFFPRSYYFVSSFVVWNVANDDESYTNKFHDKVCLRTH